MVILFPKQKTVKGNNVFVATNSTILLGAVIGNNVIVAAGSVVYGRIPSNVVMAGNSAKVKRTLQAHYRLRKERYIDEAKLCAKTFLECYNRKPTIEEWVLPTIYKARRKGTT